MTDHPNSDDLAAKRCVPCEGGVPTLTPAEAALLAGGPRTATVVALTPAAQSPLWQGSALARWLDAGVRGMQPLLPPELARHPAR